MYRNDYNFFSQDTKDQGDNDLNDVISSQKDIYDSSVHSSRTNSAMSSCLSTDTSSVVMNIRNETEKNSMEEIKGVTDFDISQLKSWLDCNKLDE